jgi:hypothetical protein
MEMNWMLVALILGAVVVLFVLVITLVVVILKSLSGGRGGGWSALVEKYPAAAEPSATMMRRRTIQVGRVACKNCTTVAACPEGLYLAVASPFSAITGELRPVLVPWGEIKGIGEAKLYWQTVKVLQIGSPQVATVSVSHDVFAQLQPFLSQAAAAR